MKALAIILTLLGLVISIPCVLNYMSLAKSLDDNSVLMGKAQRMMNDPVSDYYGRQQLNDAMAELASGNAHVKAVQREDVVFISVGVIMLLVGAVILTSHSSTGKETSHKE